MSQMMHSHDPDKLDQLLTVSVRSEEKLNQLVLNLEKLTNRVDKLDELSTSVSQLAERQANLIEVKNSLNMAVKELKANQMEMQEKVIQHGFVINSASTLLWIIVTALITGVAGIYFL